MFPRISISNKLTWKSAGSQQVKVEDLRRFRTKSSSSVQQKEWRSRSWWYVKWVKSRRKRQRHYYERVKSPQKQRNPSQSSRKVMYECQNFSKHISITWVTRKECLARLILTILPLLWLAARMQCPLYKSHKHIIHRKSIRQAVTSIRWSRLRLLTSKKVDFTLQISCLEIPRNHLLVSKGQRVSIDLKSWHKIIKNHTYPRKYEGCLWQ